MENHGDSSHSDIDEMCINNQRKHSLPITERSSSASSTLYNVLFGAMVVVGQTAQNVVLPLFVDSGKNSNERVMVNNTNSTVHFVPFMDSFFVALFVAFLVAAIFGISFVVKSLSLFLRTGQTLERRISITLAAFTGFLCAVSGVLIVFSSSGKRTAPYLQAILINSTIPTTLVLRYCVLNKKPTKKKLICALATVLSLFLCLLPSIFPKIDPKHKKDKEQGGAKGLMGILWPAFFMLGFVFAAASYVAQEKLLQYVHASSKKKVDLLYIMFLIQLFQFIFMVFLFWMDALPLFGSVDSIKKVFLNFTFGLKCSFGHAGCSLYPALYGFLFTISFICYFIGGACLIRYAEGATYLAIVSAIVTPAGFTFWTFFKEQPYFHWHPEVSVTVWLNIAGIAIMVPSIYFYNSTKARTTPRDLETTPLLEESD